MSALRLDFIPSCRIPNCITRRDLPPPPPLFLFKSLLFRLSPNHILRCSARLFHHQEMN